MNIQLDFVELLKLLEKHKVDYMIVGGYAVAFHGHPRFTKDIDLFFRINTQNIEKLRQALIEFGFSDNDVPVDAFTTVGNVLTFGVPPVRVDLLNSIDGIEYDSVKSNVVRGVYGGVEVTFIGFEDLIKNKESTSRIKDKGDVEELIG